MISYAQALQIIRKVASVHRAEKEEVPLLDSIGRLLAEDGVSRENVPAFTNSSMDGFAFRAQDTAGASTDHPLTFQVKGMVSAGDLEAFQKWSYKKQGDCIEIMTGAPLPAGGYDCVEKIENVQVNRNSAGQATSVTVSRPLVASENLRHAGSDFKPGQLAVKAGTWLNSEHIIGCATLGISALRVKRNPRVSIISTGNEIVDFKTDNLEPGIIRNSTAPFLMAALSELKIKPEYLGIVSDDSNHFLEILKNSLRNRTEIILSTGAVSMGQYDFVVDAIRSIGAVIHFHKVAIKPGKPLLFAEISFEGHKAIFFGIPGNPVSSAIALRFFIEPMLREMLELPHEIPRTAILEKSTDKPRGLRTFLKGNASLKESQLWVEALGAQGSHQVSSLSQANCWIEIPEESERVSAGEKVHVYPLRNHLGII